jgi:RNA polymerase sigma factor (sigma-70 family)
MHAVARPQAAHDPARDEAFERLYRQYARDVYRYSLALLRNPADAEDITQTTFLNAYRAYLRGEEPVRPRNWLIKIAHNACRSRHLRAVRRPQEVPLAETVTALPVPAEEAPKVEDLLDALGRLPFNQRAALVMRELEGRSYVEIAETLGVSVAAVETLIFRARRSLRREPSLLGALGAVQLPPSLSTLVGGGGGAAALAGGGAVAGSGLVAKAALLVAAGLVAGTVGTAVESKLAAGSPKAAIVLAPPPLLVRGTPSRVPARVQVTRWRTSKPGPVLRSTRSSSTRSSRTVQPVFGSAAGASQQSSSVESNAPVPAASAPTASSEAPAASSSSPSSSPVGSTVDEVTSAAPPPPSVEPPSLPPVPPPPALPVAAPSLPDPELPSTPALPPPPPLPDLP